MIIVSFLLLRRDTPSSFCYPDIGCQTHRQPVLGKQNILRKRDLVTTIWSPSNNYMLKVNNINTRKMCGTWSKLRIKTPHRPQWRCSGIFILNFERISHILLLLTLNKLMLAKCVSKTNCFEKFHNFQKKTPYCRSSFVKLC